MMHDLRSELGFASRDDLIEDLREALRPGSSPGVLAIFALDGAEEYRRVNGESAGERLNGRLAEEFLSIVRPVGRCYTSRQDELCALFHLPIDIVSPILAAASIAIRREGEISLVTTSFGVALLPGQATGPIEALIAADQNLVRARRNRERQAGAPDDHA